MNTEVQEIQITPDTPDTSVQDNATTKQQRRTIVALIVTIIIILAILITGFIFLISPNTTTLTVARIRDIFIILMALESLFVGIVLVILMVQLARLINLLQNEVQPILDSTNETISNLRGTTEFLSSNLAEPVIKLNEYLAGFNKLSEIFGLKRKH